MDKKKEIALLVLIIILLCISESLSAPYRQKTLCEYESILSTLGKARSSLESKIDSISSGNDNDALYEQLKRQERDNMALEQENQDLRVQIQEFGWMKEGK